MKRIVTGLMAASALLCVGAARADDKVTLQLKWVTQAQFAGYYVAKDKGCYKDAGLDVTIKPASTCSGATSGPPGLIVTSSPASL